LYVIKNTKINTAVEISRLTRISKALFLMENQLMSVPKLTSWLEILS
jgi:hypothetical protein